MMKPTDPLTEMEKRVFGEHAVRHPVTGEPQEDGSGSVRHEERVGLASARDVAPRHGGDQSIKGFSENPLPADVALETALDRLGDLSAPIVSPPAAPATERTIDLRTVHPFPDRMQ